MITLVTQSGEKVDVSKDTDECNEKFIQGRQRRKNGSGNIWVTKPGTTGKCKQSHTEELKTEIQKYHPLKYKMKQKVAMKLLSLEDQILEVMDIQSTKLELMRLLLNTQKEQVLQRVKEIFEQEEDVDFWDNLDEELKASIERGLSESDRGEVKSHEVVMEKYKKWL